MGMRVDGKISPYYVGEILKLCVCVQTTKPPENTSFLDNYQTIFETKPTTTATFCWLTNLKLTFFPRASERRVLLELGVCYTSSHVYIFFPPSHLHVFPSSHLLIFTSSHFHIFTFSHLLIFSSSHLHICTSSHVFTSSHFLSLSLSLLPSVAVSLLFFLRTRRHEIATISHEMRFKCQKMR